LVEAACPRGAFQVRYFLLSKYIPANRLLRIVRPHCGIENQLHWVLDVVFNEDRNRTRKDNAPENLVRSHPAATSLRQKIKRAGWEDAVLLGTLGHMRFPSLQGGGEQTESAV
jgi:hypothetical protein